MFKRYYIYILTNKTRVLYVGFTNDLNRRMIEHKNGTIGGFTKKFNLNRLVYFEEYETLAEAIETEKWLKGMRRERLIKIIEESNPAWDDLTESIPGSAKVEKSADLSSDALAKATRPRKDPGAEIATELARYERKMGFEDEDADEDESLFDDDLEYDGEAEEDDYDS